jgi:hypothetical protein
MPRGPKGEKLPADVIGNDRDAFCEKRRDGQPTEGLSI